MADEKGTRWPFDRALLRLDYGERLRRLRRIREARGIQEQGLESLTALGATPYAERARSELRACGIGALGVAGRHELRGVVATLGDSQENAD
jgi:hypothetical protein